MKKFMSCLAVLALGSVINIHSAFAQDSKITKNPGTQKSLVPPVKLLAKTPFTIELGCAIVNNGSTYQCEKNVTPSGKKRFVIETVSFTGQAKNGYTAQAYFTFYTGGTKAFVWLPTQNLGPSVSTGKSSHVTTIPVRLRVDPGSAISLTVYNTSPADGETYNNRLNLMGYME